MKIGDLCAMEKSNENKWSTEYISFLLAHMNFLFL